MHSFIRRSFRLNLERFEAPDLPSNVITIREATGTNLLSIQAALGAFRADLGVLNANVRVARHWSPRD